MGGSSEIGFVVVDPGHFHAALVQKEMHPGVSPSVQVYAPLGPDLIDYLGRIARFNTRPERPTAWRVEAHAGTDFLARMARERPGQVAIFSGRNRGKIERIKAAVEAGLHVLADKPVIVRQDELPVLERVLDEAERRGLVVLDLMAGRVDPLAAILRGLVQDPAVFGRPRSIESISVHHLMKQVAGAPNRRPAWYFDIDEQGEGIADIGTHLVDRIHGALFPEQALDWRRDIALDAAERWPTVLSLAQFQEVTGEPAWPDVLAPWLRGDAFQYFCNMRLDYRVRGVAVRLETRWDWQAPPGGDDTHAARWQGERAHLELRQGPTENYRPELYVVPDAEIGAALAARVAALESECPGVALTPVEGGGWRLDIPPALRPDHDTRFTLFTRRFLDFVARPGALPAWEKPNMMAKYHVCTGAVALSRAAWSGEQGESDGA